MATVQATESRAIPVAPILIAMAVGALVVLDRLLDMARTAVNVFADATCAVIVARLEGEQDVLK